MKQITFDKSIISKLKLISSGENSFVFLYNNKILKIFNPLYITLNKITGCDIERKILLSETLSLPNTIIKPFEIVYDENGNFIGYTMFGASGINFNHYNDCLSEKEKGDLYNFGKIQQNLEKAISQTPEIVYPDLCTCDNIFIDKKRRIQLLDYDGFQIKDQKTGTISTTLGDHETYIDSKKYYNNGLFTKELDVKSLIYLYFLYTFNTNLGKVGEFVPFSKEKITLDYIFNTLNLDNDDIKQKVWYLFQEDYRNEYLGEDVFVIAENYDMIVYPHPFDKNLSIKRLVRK